MLAYFLRRVIYALPIMVGVALVCFLLVHLAPGDPLVSILPPDASADLQAQLRELYGFNRSLPEQFAMWVWRAMHGDLGVSMMSGAEARVPVTELKAHIPRMEGFHRRYMVSNKILRLWVRMVRQLDISMLVPQHGAPIMGKQAISDFFTWIENLMCGIDLFDDRAYQIPTGYIDPVTRQTRAGPER